MYRMEQSPFHKERELKGTTKPMTFRLPLEVYDDLMDYFEDLYDKNPLVNGLRELTINTLDNVCREKKRFDNLNIVMLIPNYANPNDIKMEHQIIGFIDDDNDFDNDFNKEIIKRDFPSSLENDLPCELLEFDEDFFPLDVLAHVKDGCFSGITKSELSTFRLFKKALEREYPNISLDYTYFAILPLNNYLDEYRDGQYQSPTINNHHIGIHVLFSPIIQKKFLCAIEWSYSNETGYITLESKLFDEKELNSIAITGANIDEDMKKAILDCYDGDYRLEYMLSLRKDLINSIEGYKDTLEKLESIMNKEYPDVLDD